MNRVTCQFHPTAALTRAAIAAQAVLRFVNSFLMFWRVWARYRSSMRLSLDECLQNNWAALGRTAEFA